MELTLHIKQLKIFGKKLFPGQEIHYAGVNPQSLAVALGSPPANRQWTGYPDYIDVTDEVSDLYKLKLTWSIQRDNQGNSLPGEFAAKKSASGSLTFEGEAYRLLKQWLIDDVSAALNAVDVKIVDSSCGAYHGYQIKSGDLQWCEDSTCTFDVTLKQQDENITCIKRTLITDDWQGWFRKVPLNGKKHPRFSYCNEVRPNGTLILIWWMAGVVMMPTLLVLIPILLGLNALFFVINTIINTINFIINIVGGNPLSNTPITPISYISFQDILDAFGNFYVESAGCGREHPAPLIRDYIKNVCDRCDIDVTPQSAPIFFAQSLTLNTSSRGQIEVTNHHYNACYFSPGVKRGIRRFRSIGILGLNPNNDEFWIPDNGPIKTLDLFLDDLKTVYNAEWRVENNTLFFQRKDFYLDSNYVYDFSPDGPDRPKIVKGLCFEPNETKYPAYCTGIYSPDGGDACGAEAGNINGTGQMNGIVSFGDIDNNPNYESVLDKGVQFGATKFRLDGASTDYIYDAMQVVCNGAVFTPFSVGQMRDFVAPAIRQYADYALLMSDENSVLPKILIWSGDSYLNAKAIKLKAAWDGVAPQPMPDPNPVYNSTPEQWKVRHRPDTDVIGKNLTFPPSPDGVYQVTDYFGIVVTENPAILVNYPMYFEPFYLDTLWDYFHWIDDPKVNPRMNMNWNACIELCCDDIKHLGLLNDSSNVKLGQRVKLPFGYYKDGVLKEIEVSYATDDTYGKYIKLSGTL